MIWNTLKLCVILPHIKTESDYDNDHSHEDTSDKDKRLHGVIGQLSSSRDIELGLLTVDNVDTRLRNLSIEHAGQCPVTFEGSSRMDAGSCSDTAGAFSWPTQTREKIWDLSTDRLPQVTHDGITHLSSFLRDRGVWRHDTACRKLLYYLWCIFTKHLFVMA